MLKPNSGAATTTTTTTTSQKKKWGGLWDAVGTAVGSLAWQMARIVRRRMRVWACRQALSRTCARAAILLLPPYKHTPPSALAVRRGLVLLPIIVPTISTVQLEPQLSPRASAAVLDLRPSPVAVRLLLLLPSPPSTTTTTEPSQPRPLFINEGPPSHTNEAYARTMLMRLHVR